MLSDDPGRVRSQTTSVMCHIQRFDFDCILVVSRKVIIRIPPVLGSNLYGGHSLRSRIEAPLISPEVLPETYFLLVVMAVDAHAHKHHAYVEPCKNLISLAASSISEI